MTVVIPKTDAEAARTAQEILKNGWDDHMWAFENFTQDEENWLRAWCGLIEWDAVNTKPRCHHGFIADECPNAGCGL